jgi:phage terminase large subunit
MRFHRSISGAYFGKQMQDAEAQGRITSVERLEDRPVHTAWDLGVSDYTSIWAYQIVGAELGCSGA